MKKRLLFLAVFFAIPAILTGVLAQGRTDTSPENALPRPIISPSPEAGSLGKYGDVPVGLFKGTPNIDIPFYTLTKGDISVPVSINYSSNGTRADEIATSIGLGWTLMAGGVVTASAVDKNDLSSSYSRNLPIDPNNFHPNTTNISNSDYLFAKSYVSGRSAYDLEPDVFTYSFCGRSGKFFFDTGLQVGHTIPASSVKIYRDASGFTITDERGTRYIFTTVEGSFVTDSCTVGTTPRETASLHNSYYLTQIVDAKGNTVNLTYETTDYYYSQGTEEAQYFSQLTGSCGLLTSHNSTCIKVQTVSGKRIKTISASDNSVTITFNYSATARQDLSSLAGTAHVMSQLDQVVVSAGTKVIKTFALGHDYFRSSGYDAAPNAAQRSLQCRLKLTSVTEVGKQPYTFGYCERNNFPARIISGGDYWGYYNNGGGTNIPVIPDLGNNGRYLKPDLLSTLTGMLTKIRYPTGGTTTFEYEPNDNWVWNSIGEMVPHEVSCGALPHTSDTCIFHFDYDIKEPNIVYNLDAGGHDPGFASIDGPNGIHLEFSGHGSITLNQFGYLNVLPAGNYTVIAENTLGLGKNHININWLHYETSMHLDYLLMGGLRIAKTVDSAIIGPPVKKFYRYNLLDTGRQTSLFFKPISPQNYDYPYHAYHQGTDGGTVECDYHVLHSAPIPLIGKGDRNDYGYTKVTVLTDSLGTLGKTVHYYSSGIRDFLPSISGITDQTWMSGIERAREDFLFNPALQKYVIAQRVRNTYTVNLSSSYLNDNANSSLPPNQFSLYGFKLTQERPEFVSANVVTAGTFNVERYPVVSAWYYQSRADQTVFNTADTTKFVTTSTSTYFDNPAHQQETRTVTAGSDGRTVTYITTYPDDYAAGTAFIDDMKTNHQIGMPIEQVAYMNDGTKTNVTSGKLTQYLAGGKGLPSASYNFESSAPVALTAFKFSDRASGQLPYGTTPAAFAMDSHYAPKLTYDSYDNTGNPLNLTLVGGMSESFIWDYKKAYPIARATNADSLSIAYTSFEADGSGHWTISSASRDTSSAKTGRASLNAASWTLTKGGLSASTPYTVSYWSKSASAFTVSGTPASGYPFKGPTARGWTYYEHRVSGVTSVTVSGGGSVDEVRLYPSRAQMTTYTYDPLVGMTSTTDTKGFTAYFEYDGSQRLLNVKDQNGSILKNYAYNYASQGANWQNTAATPQCVQAATGGNSGEELIQQSDTNPYSPTYTKTRWVSNGTNTTVCPLQAIVYLRMTVGSTSTSNGVNYNTYVFKAYSDEACTTPYSVPSALTVNYRYVTSRTYADGRSPNPVVTTTDATVTIPADANQASGSSIPVSGCFGINEKQICYSTVVTLQPGTGYVVDQGD